MKNLNYEEPNQEAFEKLLSEMTPKFQDENNDLIMSCREDMANYFLFEEKCKSRANRLFELEDVKSKLRDDYKSSPSEDTSNLYKTTLKKSKRVAEIFLFLNEKLLEINKQYSNSIYKLLDLTNNS